MSLSVRHILVFHNCTFSYYRTRNKVCSVIKNILFHLLSFQQKYLILEIVFGCLGYIRPHILDF